MRILLIAFSCLALCCSLTSAIRPIIASQTTNASYIAPNATSYTWKTSSMPTITPAPTSLDNNTNYTLGIKSYPTILELGANGTDWESHYTSCSNTELCNYCASILRESFYAGNSCIVTTTSTYNESIAPATSIQTCAQSLSYFHFTATPPCCADCTIFGNNIHVLYWPTAIASPVSEVVTKGTTLYSPTIYIAFSSLMASDLCGQVGDTYANQIVAIEPNDISTIDLKGVTLTLSPGLGVNPYTSVSYTTLSASFDFANLTTCPPFQLATVTIPHPYPGGTLAPPPTITEEPRNPCNPNLMIPTAVRKLDRQWARCMATLGGAYGPPSAIQRLTGLIPDSNTIIKSFTIVALPSKNFLIDPSSFTSILGISQSTHSTVSASSGAATYAPLDPTKTLGDPSSKYPSSAVTDRISVEPSTVMAIDSLPGMAPIALSQYSILVEIATSTARDFTIAATYSLSDASTGPGDHGLKTPSSIIADIIKVGASTGPAAAQSQGSASYKAGNPQPSSTVDVGAIILSAFGSPSKTSNSKNQDHSRETTATPNAFLEGGVALAASSYVAVLEPTGSSYHTSPSQVTPSGGNKPTNSILLQGHTLLHNSATLTIDHATLAYSSGFLYINGNPIPIRSDPANVGDVGNSRSENHIVIQGHTLSENAPATIMNSVVLAYTSGTFYINGDPVAASYKPTDKEGLAFTTDRLTLSLDPSYHADSTAIPAININGHLITKGSSATTIDGTRIAFSDNSIYIGTKAYPTPTNTNQAPDPAETFIDRLMSAASPLDEPAFFTIGGQTASIVDASRLAIGSATITLGAHGTTLDNQFISFGTDGLVVGSSTVSLPFGDPALPITTVVDGKTFTATSGIFADGSLALSAHGPGATISKSVISVDTAGSLVVETATVGSGDAATTSVPESTGGTAGGVKARAVLLGIAIGLYLILDVFV